MFIVFELASGFCNSLAPFLAVRALYGICMGVSSTLPVSFHPNADQDRVSLLQQQQPHWKISHTTLVA